MGGRKSNRAALAALGHIVDVEYATYVKRKERRRLTLCDPLAIIERWMHDR